ncbi:MAG: phosphate signaling complex protein PhoU [Pirellulales bacterium]|mgnify:CR=1 FL=1|nr:phosphate signaling complex protein PhoU [Pirellulales bacterium]MBX3433899.1 phosphate signaling complex protein PhoU [Pirellulales bacterium]
MSKHLQRDLKDLEQSLLDQSAVVEQMVYRACEALRELNTDGLREVMADEEQVNRREVQIEEDCLKILALHQPVAVDLRRVAMVMKINTDLERIADLAVNIGERARSLVMHPEFDPPANLDQMAEIAISMVRDALDAFVRLDVEAAREVCLRDDEVDGLNRQVIADMYDLIAANPSEVEPALHFYSASRHVERIGDHATNIAEDVIYLVEGEIARHRGDNVAI